MVQYDRYVLNTLLDTYESSLLSTGENRRNIHIEFRFTKKSMPAYFDESSSEYERIHFFMEELEEKRLIGICWKGKKEGHIIAKVQLNAERLDEAYAYVRRVPKNDMAKQHLRLLEAYISQNPPPVCRAFAKYLQERLFAHKSVKEFIRLEDPASTRQLLDTIRAIEENQTQLYIREFSIRCFQDSKVFEKMEGRIAHVFRKFKEGCEGAAYDEILAEYGIYHTPNYVYLKGNVPLVMRGERIDLSVFRQGLGISGEDMEGIRFCSTANVKQVITIENLTTYFRWQEEDSLLVYLGGYHNGVRRTLLKEIYASYPDAVYYHFGDIDAGGFEIYRDLREKTGIPFRMYHMDLSTLQAHAAYTKHLTENDRKRLLGMREWEELRGIIDYMLEQDTKLEQECIGCESIAAARQQLTFFYKEVRGGWRD